MQLPDSTDIAQAAKAFECEEQRILGWKSETVKKSLLGNPLFYVSTVMGCSGKLKLDTKVWLPHFS